MGFLGSILVRDDFMSDADLVRILIYTSNWIQIIFGSVTDWVRFGYVGYNWVRLIQDRNGSVGKT